MVHKGDLVVIGISVGVGVGIIIASLVFFGICWYRKRGAGASLRRSVDQNSLASLPIRNNISEISIDLSSTLSSNGSDPPQNLTRSWWHRNKNDKIVSASGIPRYSYKDIQKATHDFTTVIGEGSFGPVYKAKLLIGDVVAVKVLASNSKQGEREFQTEVSLLGRLHHRNLVNLVGYCVDKGQRMLIYEYMSNGSLANHLYNEEERALSWEERLQIALDISHGIEYLHDGAVPPVIHRDLKSANILLDGSMRAKVADFGLSKEESFDGHNSGLKGTYGYIDPAYISTNKFTAKSDIYSFGVILFELITAIHPHQNLVEYVNLAAMSPDGVDEILDKRIAGTCNPEEVRSLASIANKCLRRTPRKRSSIVEVSQAILKIKQMRLKKEDTMSFAAGGDLSRMVSRIEQQQVELKIIGAAAAAGD